MSARFGSLTFAKRWLVGWAKGNVPNVGRLSAFLSCGSAKKLNLFSFIVILFFILKPFYLSFSVLLSFFFALLVTVECSSSKGLRASSLSTYTKLNARQNAKIPSETLITATLCCALVFCFSVIFIFQFATSFLSAVRSDRHTLCQTSAWGTAWAVWQCVWLYALACPFISD